MKNIILIFCCITIVVVETSAQKYDDERMNRDVEVTENVLTTLIKQQFNNQRMFFPLEIKGNYQVGYGVTFTMPADFTTPVVFTTIGRETNTVNVGSADRISTNSFQFDINHDSPSNTMRLRDTEKEKQTKDTDSIRNVYNLKVIEAGKIFILDYGDMLTQIPSQEKIVVTNMGSQPRAWMNHFFNSSKRSLLSIEMTKADLLQYKAGKITRDQALSKIKIINTETVDAAEPDLELLASMLNRLYRPDLSKTYFTENYVYYERLKNFGVIYYMQVFSNYERDYQRYFMPTVGLDNVDLETRNKKVIELYPRFEQDLKENMLEYGRTLKSIKEDEMLVFQITMTRCPECGIPSSLECSIKGSVLKDFSRGNIDKSVALNKIVLRKGSKQ